MLNILTARAYSSYSPSCLLYFLSPSTELMTFIFGYVHELQLRWSTQIHQVQYFWEQILSDGESRRYSTVDAVSKEV